MTLQEVIDQRVASFRHLLVEGFVSAAANDTLTERQLGIYLAQNIHYLEALAKSLLEVQREFADAAVLEILGRHSSEALKTCSEMRRLLAEFPGLSTMARDPIRPTTYAYINHQRLCVTKVQEQAYGVFCPAISSKDESIFKRCRVINPNKKPAKYVVPLNVGDVDAEFQSFGFYFVACNHFADKCYIWRVAQRPKH